jgi:hypothetical protein
MSDDVIKRIFAPAALVGQIYAREYGSTSAATAAHWQRAGCRAVAQGGCEKATQYDSRWAAARTPRSAV